MNIPRFQRMPIDTSVFNQMLNIKEPNLNLIGKIRKLIKEETGADPYMDPSYRGAKYTKSRQLFFYFVRRYAGLSLYETGKLLEKDHSTVVHAEKCVKKFNEIELDYKQVFDRIEKQIINMKNRN